jgi:geranylgeranyl diphosphate synthase type I
MEWMTEVRRRVDARLESYLDGKHDAAGRLSAESAEFVDAVRSLTMRGGKRLRPAVLFAAYSAVRADSADDDVAPTVDASAALELLQTYLLIHDDWMDGDDQRRGGPSVHVALTKRLGDAHLGASVAVLAGDLASAYALELFCGARFPSARLPEALAAFQTMHEEVVLGQHLDLTGTGDVSLMQQLKTGSYTVRGPLALGALLGDGSAEQISQLIRFGAPLGVAFQLRDDLLGTFGDPAATGKPAGNDLRTGKRTALSAAAERLLTPGERGQLDWLRGRLDASDAEVARAAALLVSSGARAEVERELTAQVEAAKAALEGGSFSSRGRERLSALLRLLTERDR